MIIFRPAKTRNWTVSVDGRFKSVCEEGSLDIVGVVTDKPSQIGSTIKPDGSMTFRTSILPWRRPNRIVVKVSGVRKGFAGVRFEHKTKKDYDINEMRLNINKPEWM